MGLFNYDELRIVCVDMIDGLPELFVCVIQNNCVVSGLFEVCSVRKTLESYEEFLKGCIGLIVSDFTASMWYVAGVIYLPASLSNCYHVLIYCITFQLVPFWILFVYPVLKI